MDDVTRNLLFFVLFNIAHGWHFGVCRLKNRFHVAVGLFLYFVN